MGAVDIVPANGLGNFLAFCRLPRLIYADRPGFAPLLDAERWTLYGGKLNPHFKLVDWQTWIAKRDGVVVGRIMAQMYKNGLTPNEASPAQFGCLDAIEDAGVVEALLKTAEGWLRTHGETVIHGPFSPTINGELGTLIEGFEARPMILMPWNPPYLPRLIEAAGYGKARDLISYRYEVGEADRAAAPGIVARPEWRDRLKIREIDLKNLKAEVTLLVDIFNDAWAENWGFVPFTYDELKSTADGLRFIMPDEGGFVVELDGAAQAFGVIIPNLHEITADMNGRLFPFGVPRLVSRIRKHAFTSGRLALFGIRRAIQRKAAGGAVLLAFIEECRLRSRRSSIEHVEFGWVLENNLGMRRPIERAGAQIDKVHRIYEKRVSA